MKSRKSKPIEITEGSVTVKIYYTPARLKLSTINQKPSTRLYPSWTLKYWLSGQLQRKQSSDLGKLTIEAQNAARRIANAQTATLTMTDAEVAEYISAREKLPPGISLIAAAETSAELVNIVRTNKAASSFNLQPLAFATHAARYYVDRHKDILPISTVKLVEQFLAAKKTDGVGAIHLYALKNNLGRWTKHFQCNIADVTGNDIQAWLRGRTSAAGVPLGAQTRLHDLRAISNLCNYAKQHGYLPKNWDELDNINVGILPETVIGTYTPAQLERILRGAMGHIDLKSEVEWTTFSTLNHQPITLNHVISDFDRAAFKANIPYIVTGAYAGLRTAERLRTAWASFNWETGFIHVTGKRTGGRTTRSNSRRLVPIHPALRDWLEPFIPLQGTPAAEKLIAPYSACVAGQRLRLLALAVDVTPIENGLRHSYISYRCAELKGDKTTVANESGNSVGTINKHYLDLKTPAQAAAWFGLRREQAKNITQLKATA